MWLETVAEMVKQNKVLGQMQGEGRDIFYLEEPEMLAYFKKYFEPKDGKKA
jgi:hypothetical protein